ncbi:hypothetical protein F9L08_27520 [Brucella tritici]|uniref:Uncharacterized protein n=2 Tax=Brucella tritici TaxID=94626 RepID=A0A6L3Y3C7_9HYPH|nr:hypothetical protein F9L08_27520 [Brucella tritici]
MNTLNFTINRESFELNIIEQDENDTVLEVYSDPGTREFEGYLYVSHDAVDGAGIHNAISDALYNDFVAQKAKADVASTDWKMIADETDEDVPEMVKAVYRKGEDRNRHLILLDDHGAGFFGLELKPRPSNVNIKVPDAHVDLHVRGDQILITFWDGDQRNTVTLTEEDPADWQKALDEARNSPAGLVVDELYHGELNGDGKFDRDEDE